MMGVPDGQVRYAVARCRGRPCWAGGRFRAGGCSCSVRCGCRRLVSGGLQLGFLFLRRCRQRGLCGGASGSAAAAGGGVINVGVIGGFSGTQASSADPAEQGIQAWADSVNAAGGLAGHKVNLIIKDDQDSASLGIADAKELVTQDKVAAVLADWSNTDIQWGPYLKQQGVPVIGGANLAESLQDSDYFPVGTDGNSQATVMMQAAAKAGVTKLAVAYCSEALACAEVDSLVKASQAASGVKVSWSGGFSQTAPSYTAQCLAAKNSGANGMFIAAASEADVRFATACAQQGYKPVEVTLGSTATPDWAQVPAL